MKEINQIRLTNLLGLSFIVISNLLYLIPECLYGKPYFAGLAVVAGYLFICFSLWFFFVFLFTEVKYSLKAKINFLIHVIRNKLVLWGVLLMILHVSVLILSNYFCD